MENKTESTSKCSCPYASTILAFLSIILMCFTAFNAYKTANFDKYAPSWRTDNTSMAAYRAVTNHYNEQKQLVIDAYNNQLDKIAKNGLKTQDDFHGLKFKANVFKDGVRSDKSEIVGAINCRPMFLSYTDEMFNNARRKINKLSQYYNGKIDSIYDNLKNDKKVDFESLKEYDDGPDSAQFTYNDFETIGERYAEYANMTNQMLLTIGLGIVTIVLIGMTAACRQ